MEIEVGPLGDYKFVDNSKSFRVSPLEITNTRISRVTVTKKEGELFNEYQHSKLPAESVVISGDANLKKGFASVLGLAT
jgi:hypothetical protein